MDNELLRLSINSIINQTYENWELVVVSDGANPETLKVLGDFRDPRIIVIEQSNDGPSSRNTALRHISGDYVCFIDADDCRSPWSFDEIDKLIEKEEQYDLIFCKGFLQNRNDKIEQFYDNDQFDICANMDNKTFEQTLSLVSLMEPQSANKFINRGFLIEKFFSSRLFYEDYFQNCLLNIANALVFLV